MAAGLYKLLKLLKYEEVNGDQDKAGNEPQDEEKASRGGSVQPRGHRKASQRSQLHSRENRRSSQLAPKSPHKISPAQRSFGPSPVRYPNGAPYIQDVNARIERQRDIRARPVM